MGILDIIVLFIIAVSALVGYYRGFLRVIYSVASWVIIFVFVTFATPHLTAFLENNTKLKSEIQIKCEQYLRDNADNMMTENTTGEITGSAALAIGEILTGGGLYEAASENIAHFMIEGIAFFAIMIISGIVTFSITRVLNVASRIPVIRGPNKVLGAAAGGLKGLAAVWLLFYIVSLCAAGGVGADLLSDIKGSPFLGILYENNVLLLLLSQLLKK